MKKLSIVIVNFNTYTFLSACLDSIFESIGPKKDTEVIIVDNNSNDNSVQQILKNYKQVRLIVNKKNMGFAAANNQAIRKSQGKYILLLNPDTVLKAKTLTVMLSFMEKNPKCGISTCVVELAGGILDDACHRGFPTPWNALCHFIGLSRLFTRSTIFNGYHLGYHHMDQTHEIDSCAGAFMLIRRKAAQEVDWLDEDYFWYGEDIDFCYKVKQAGWNVMYVPDTKIIHQKGVASGIKRHSKHLSLATYEIRQKAMKARFDVMRIFYQKHYQNRYPGWLTEIVLAGIKLKRFIHSSIV